MLFDPGRYVSYSNGGMIVAGRLLEVVTGTAYADLLEREVFATVGMDDSCTSAEKAILRSTAVGHFLDPQRPPRTPDGHVQAPGLLGTGGSYPDRHRSPTCWRSPERISPGAGRVRWRLLSAESIGRMQQVWHDMRTPNVPPIGLGWLLTPFGSTTVLSMSGASPGGVAVLAVVPEHDLAFAAFGNDPRAMVLHDQLLLWLLRRTPRHRGADLVRPACVR